MQIKFLAKEGMFPNLGRYFPKENRIEIRNDLPHRIRDFVVLHELSHSRNFRSWGENSLLEEIRANIYASLKDPYGFILTSIFVLKEKVKRLRTQI